MFELAGCEPLLSPLLFWTLVFLGSAISTFALLTRGLLGGFMAIFAISCGTAYIIAGGAFLWPMVKFHAIWNTVFMFAFLGLLRVQSFLRHGRIRFAETDLTRGDA